MNVWANFQILCCLRPTQGGDEDIEREGREKKRKQWCHIHIFASQKKLKLTVVGTYF